MLPLMSKTSPTATGSSSIEKWVMVCSTRSSSTRKCSFSSPVTGRFWGSHTETGTSTRLVSMRRLAEGLDSGGGTPSFGRGSVFTCPRKASGNSAANAAARLRIRRARDIDGLGVYCTPPQSRALILGQGRRTRDRRSERGAGAAACQPRARIKSWQAKAPAPPFCMKFRGPKAHPNGRQKAMAGPAIIGHGVWRIARARAGEPARGGYGSTDPQAGGRAVRGAFHAGDSAGGEPGSVGLRGKALRRRVSDGDPADGSRHAPVESPAGPAFFRGRIRRGSGTRDPGGAWAETRGGAARNGPEAGHRGAGTEHLPGVPALSLIHISEPT